MVLYIAEMKGEFYNMIIGELIHISSNRDYTIKLEDGSQKTLENGKDTFKIFKDIDSCSEFIFQKNGLYGYEEKRMSTFKKR
jgi:hypothetical protein